MLIGIIFRVFASIVALIGLLGGFWILGKNNDKESDKHNISKIFMMAIFYINCLIVLYSAVCWGFTCKDCKKLYPTNSGFGYTENPNKDTDNTNK